VARQLAARVMRGITVAARMASKQRAERRLDAHASGGDGSDESWADVAHLVFDRNDRDNDGSLSAAEVAAALMGRCVVCARGARLLPCSHLGACSLHDPDVLTCLEKRWMPV